MAAPTNINRLLLGYNGLDMSEADYVQVVAGLGAKTSFSKSTPSGLPFSLRWSSPQFRDERNRPRNAAQLREVGAMWTALKVSTNKQLLIDTDDMPSDSPDLIEIVRILSHPAAGLVSVAVDLSSPHAEDQWQWPLRVVAFPDDFAELDLKKLDTVWPSSSITRAHELSREQPRAEVLIIRADVRGALQRILALSYPVRAAYCILLTPMEEKWSDLRSHLDTLLAETRAAGVSLVSLSTGESAWGALNNWFRKLSHNEPFDCALWAAFPVQSSLHILNPPLIERAALPTAAARLVPRLRQLPPDAKLVSLHDTSSIGFSWTAAQSPSELGDELENRAAEIPYDQESRGATAISQIAAAEREARRAAASSEPPRYLQGEVVRLAQGKSIAGIGNLVMGQTYSFEVFIGESGQAPLQVDGAFPVEQLDWRKQDFYNLQVLFAEPQQWSEPLRGALTLPSRGRSTSYQFVFAPTRTGPFAGRVIVLHRGRVLQTALLRAEVFGTLEDCEKSLSTEPMRFRQEAVVRHSLGTLGDRRWFDTCLVVNHTSAQKSAITAAGKNGAYIASLEVIKPQLQSINRQLNEVALNAKAYHTGLTSKKNAELLVNLAREGNVLRRSLVQDYIQQSSAAAAIIGGEYLQIVSTQPDALVPLEFVYEYSPPKRGAAVCANAKDALRSGRCPASCVPAASPAPHVCPLGFWGLRKVIERHLHVEALDKPAPAKVICEPEVGQNVLTLKGPALVAASKQVPMAENMQLRKAVRTAWQQTVRAPRSWDEWKKGVKTAPPVLIVALPHADGTGADISLEIGGHVLDSIYIDEKYVRPDPKKPAPIALLLGCDTVNVAYTDAYARHIAVFRQADAAVVLGTVATVFGVDGAKMAGRLVNHLAKAMQAKPGRFGEILRQAKREAVADSLMIALCLVAFGDADWKLES